MMVAIGRSKAQARTAAAAAEAITIEGGFDNTEEVLEQPIAGEEARS